jgi:hypothetical protein
MKLLESVTASAGILLFSWLSIPAAAKVVGATVSTEQGVQMGLIFFVLRVVWLYALRCAFEKLKEAYARP